MDLFGINLGDFIRTVGYFGIFGIIFAESGLLIGLFLPGDSLLFTAGIVSSQGHLNIAILIAVSFAGAVLGDNFGYRFGRRWGPKIFTRNESLFFHKDYLERARVFYERHGGITVMLARFIPFIRTFAPILAGVGNMPYASFLFYNIFGGAIWAIGVPLLGYYLGRVIPDIDRYLIPLVLAIVVVSLMPTTFSLFRSIIKHERE